MILLKAKVLYQDRLFVEHSVGHNVDAMAHINRTGLSLWGMLKCARKGVHHRWNKVNRQHLHQHALEGKHDIRKNDSDNQMKTTAKKTFEQSPKCGDLVSRVDGRLNQQVKFYE